MRPFRTILGLFLAAFWLLATQHCGLEAAGVLAQHCEQEKGCADADHAGDGCKTVEDGEYRVGNMPSQIAPPLLAVCNWLTCIATAGLPPERQDETISREYVQRPLDWVPTWQFVQRTALTPRAPTAV